MTDASHQSRRPANVSAGLHKREQGDPEVALFIETNVASSQASADEATQLFSFVAMSGMMSPIASFSSFLSFSLARISS